jgi:3-keto-5-aminohexanoate cleavage enzyme
MTNDQQSNVIAIAVAPNGGTRTKSDHPAIPLSPAELAETAQQCLEAGAAMIHVHVRRKDGRHLLDSTAYRAALEAIRTRVGDGLVVQITTEALGMYSVSEQIAVLKAVRPEAASLALREFVKDQASEAEFAHLLAWMKSERVTPQIILFESRESEVLADMQGRGLIPWTDIPVLYALGRYTPGQISHPSDLLSFLAPDRPRFRHWTVCAFGRHEAASVTAAALLGGNARVGFENNLLLPDGSMARDNAESVNVVARALTGLGVAISDGPSLRHLLTSLE